MTQTHILAFLNVTKNTLSCHIVQSVTQVNVINRVKRIFPNLHLITSHKKQMKQTSVKHQYYNKVTFLQFSANTSEGPDLIKTTKTPHYKYNGTSFLFVFFKCFLFSTFPHGKSLCKTKLGKRELTPAATLLWAFAVPS